jgi:hypothetical protein
MGTSQSAATRRQARCSSGPPDVRRAQALHAPLAPAEQGPGLRLPAPSLTARRHGAGGKAERGVRARHPAAHLGRPSKGKAAGQATSPSRPHFASVSHAHPARVIASPSTRREPRKTAAPPCAQHPRRHNKRPAQTRCTALRALSNRSVASRGDASVKRSVRGQRARLSRCS